MTAEEIAAGLTEAQKRVISFATRTEDNRWLVASATASGAGPWPQGVTQYYSQSCDRLTPLGMQVRAILESNHDRA